MTEKRLTRSTKDKMLFGVCAGLANYFGLDPVLIRLIFVLLFIFVGGGLIAYVILWIIMPKDTDVQ